MYRFCGRGALDCVWLGEGGSERREFAAKYDWSRQEKGSMSLLPKHLMKQLPKLYSTEALSLKALARVKFFTPDGQWTWYASEFDGGDVFFGLVAGHEVELGYFSLTELERVHGALGLPVERDLYFKPTPLETLREKHRVQR